MISHYVVTYDHKTGKFEVDNDTTIAVFSDGTIFDEKTEDWHFPIESSEEETFDFMGSLDLQSLLDEYNDSESDEPNGQDPDGTTDLGLEPIEEEWNDEEDWCTYCQMDVEGDEAGNCPHCGNLVTLIEDTDYLEDWEGDDALNTLGDN